ncbi:MAG: aquaporin family protein [Alphaproteobacteria bacterium]|nr:aquaporin family protein [Alphaproteobacteria bacterium]
MAEEPRARRILAEGLGTLLLLATVVGSGIMAERLAGGNDAVALLGNTLATVAMLVVLITMLGPVSGAHFNPAVSAVFVAEGQLPRARLAPYVASQVVGGVLGVLLAHLMFDVAVFQWGVKMRTGPAQWLAEGVATFGLVLTILGTLATRPGFVAAAVGLYIAAAYWFTASTSFANPAVTIARALTDSFAGIRPVDAIGFIVAQGIGAAVAVPIARRLWDRR